MPGRNGTGPMGAGAMTGRGLGFCKGGDKNTGLRCGMACRRGFGQGFHRFSAIGHSTGDNRRDILQAQKNVLKDRHTAIDKRLESL
ncbi:hypothetical protein OBV_26000 [Oscillibacter valericigenes Sjm18-20]|nr:hypothetical protein OBV_26000 [Oscillibacter valericigenes Sjm18-20]